MLLSLNMADLSGLDRDLIPAQKMSQKNILKERAAAICQKKCNLFDAFALGLQNIACRPGI